jgi:hypothetical protein
MAAKTNRNLTSASVTPFRAAFANDSKILSPFDKRECISLKEAADIAGKSESTLRASPGSADASVAELGRSAR